MAGKLTAWEQAEQAEADRVDAEAREAKVAEARATASVDAVEAELAAADAKVEANKPPRSASKAVWVDHAEALGYVVDGDATKQDIIDLVG